MIICRGLKIRGQFVYFLGILSIVLTLLFSISDVQAKQIVDLTLKRATVIKISQPVTSVIVGNSEVASFQMINNKTLVLNGLQNGSTNLILYNDEKIIQELELVVSSANSDVVSVTKVQKGKPEIYSYQCTPNCVRVIIPGDVDGKQDDKQGGKQIDYGMSISQK